jgi:hypothetical protein
MTTIKTRSLDFLSWVRYYYDTTDSNEQWLDPRTKKKVDGNELWNEYRKALIK